MRRPYNSLVIRIVLLAFATMLTGCRRERVQDSLRAEASAHRAAPLGSAQRVDPAHPSIDCPLRKQGLDAPHGRPFDEVEKYIAFLEKPDRAVWQKPDEVVTALGLKGTEILIDVGAGSGYFSFRFARALPKGKVVAEDPEPEMVRHIHHRLMSEGISNMQVILSKPDVPEISGDADWVFVCDVLHHVPNRADWLTRIATAMKPSARLALIEFKEGDLPEGPPAAAKIPRDQLLSLFRSAGFVLAEEKGELLPYQVFLVFKKA